MILLFCTECGGKITNPGVIKSPMTFDKLFGTIQYPENANCTWIIQAPPDQVVRLVYVIIFRLLFRLYRF